MFFGLTMANPASVQRSGDRAATRSISDLTSPYFEANRDRLTKALQHVNLDNEDVDYDVFINLLRATCAVVAGDKTYMAEVVWPWCCTQQHARGNGPRTEDRGIEWLDERWNSFTEVSSGPTTSTNEPRSTATTKRCSTPKVIKQRRSSVPYQTQTTHLPREVLGQMRAALLDQAQMALFLSPSPTPPSPIGSLPSTPNGDTPRTRDGSSLAAASTSPTTWSCTTSARSASPSAPRSARKDRRRRK
jgi:hypothetical protein